jgi:uncharacterized membrane protein YdjX (TVP38/TMEM64 family)
MEWRKAGRIAFPAAVAALAAAALVSPLGEWLTLERVAESRDALAAAIAARPVFCAAVFFLVCVAASALCFPAAPAIGVAGGALFGLWPGLALLAGGFTIGSTLACLASRHHFRAAVQARLGTRLDAIDRGLERHGGAYLLALRINPLLPYWLVNLGIGLTTLRLRLYVPLTFLGLLPALFIYAQAGSAVAGARSASDIVSPAALVSVFLLSLLPLAADWIVTRRTRGDGGEAGLSTS